MPIRIAILPAGLLIAALGTGCATHTESGALAGSLLGAGAGAIIGNQTGDAGAGAVIGSGLGAITGSLVGAGLDENDRRNEIRVAEATAPPPRGPVSPAEVVQMTHSGVSPGVIISAIHSNDVVFQLRPADIMELHNAGVSDSVIQAMLDTAHRPTPTRVIREPVYVVEPPPRPVIFVGPRRCCPPRHRRSWGFHYHIR